MNLISVIRELFKPRRCRRAVAILVSGWMLITGVELAGAGDFAEHWHLTYALALGAGFDPVEAHVIADAAWSVDQNDDTIAFVDKVLRWEGTPAQRVGQVVQYTIDGPRLQRLLSDDAAMDQALLSPNGELRRFTTEAYLHSLFRDSRRAGSVEPGGSADTTIRAGLNAGYHRYIREQLTARRARGEDPDRTHLVGLILTGQYIHAFLDAASHPEEPLLGHFLEGHFPDFAWTRPDEFKHAAFWTLRELKNLRPLVSAVDDRLAQFSLTTEVEEKRFADAMVNALLKAYMADTYRNEWYASWWIDSMRLVVPGPLQPAVLNELVSKEIGSALRQSPFRRQPPPRPFDFTVPTYDKVEYNLLPEGRMAITYRALHQEKVEDFPIWVARHPEFNQLRRDLRETVRSSLRAYPGRLRAKLERLVDLLAEVERREKAFQEALAEGALFREILELVREARASSPPSIYENRWAEILDERVRQAERQRELEAAEIERRNRAIDERDRRAQEREWRPPDDPDHNRVRERVCRIAPQLCER